MIKKENGQVIIKLTDYGESKRFISLSNYGNTHGVGTNFYTTPEYWKEKNIIIKQIYGV